MLDTDMDNYWLPEIGSFCDRQKSFYFDGSHGCCWICIQPDFIILDFRVVFNLIFSNYLV